MTDKQIMIDVVDRDREQLVQLKAQLLDQEAETLRAGGIIYTLEKTLAEIKKIAETQQSWNEWNRQFSETESEDDIFAYNWSALKQILQKISEAINE